MSFRSPPTPPPPNRHNRVEISASPELLRALREISRDCAKRPEWQRGILEASSMQANTEPRPIPSEQEEVVADSEWQRVCEYHADSAENRHVWDYQQAMEQAAERQRRLEAVQRFKRMQDYWAAIEAEEKGGKQHRELMQFGALLLIMAVPIALISLFQAIVSIAGAWWGQ